MKGLAKLLPSSASKSKPKSQSKSKSNPKSQSGYAAEDFVQSSSSAPASPSKWKTFWKPFAGTKKQLPQPSGSNGQGDVSARPAFPGPSGSAPPLKETPSPKIVEKSAASSESRGVDAGKTAKVNNTIVRMPHTIYLSRAYPRSQKPSVYMHEFLDNRAEAALEGLLEHEKGPAKFICQECQSQLPPGSSMYRCFDCYMPPTLCRYCLVKSHRHNPFHFIQEWETRRRFWLRKPLTALNSVTLELGHDGYQCHYSTTPPRPMCIVSEQGVHRVPVRFCACKDPVTDKSVPESTQLLRHGFWPASWDKPHTAFTIRLLKDFQLLANQTSTTHYDFYKVMRRKTDNIEPQEVEVCALFWYDTSWRLQELAGSLPRIHDCDANI